MPAPHREHNLRSCCPNRHQEHDALAQRVRWARRRLEHLADAERQALLEPRLGHEHDADERAAIAAGLEDLARKIDWSGSRELGASPPSPVREMSTHARPKAQHRRKKRGVLFGYGHYAKTQIMPNVARYIEVDTVHEVDPTQIGHERKNVAFWDTAPVPRDLDDRHDARNQLPQHVHGRS